MGRKILFLYIIFSLVFLPSAFVHAKNAGAYVPEYEKSIMNKEYKKAAETLEKALSENKGAFDGQDLYKKLNDLYINYTFEYRKATDMYKEYLRKYPDGNYAQAFKQKLDELEKSKPEWNVLSMYREVVLNYDSLKPKARIAAINEVLKENLSVSTAAMINSWLAGEYNKQEKPGQANKYMQLYMKSPVFNEKSEVEKARAFYIYSDILFKLHKYDEALNAMNEVVKLGNPELVDCNYEIKQINSYKKRWFVLKIMLGFLLAIAVTIILLRPWKEKSFKWRIPGSSYNLIIFLGTAIIPMIVAYKTYNGIVWVFPALSLSAVVSLVFVKLLVLLSIKISRALYLMLCFMVILAWAYVALYCTDYLAVLNF